MLSRQLPHRYRTCRVNTSPSPQHAVWRSGNAAPLVKERRGVQSTGIPVLYCTGSQVKSIHKQQTTIRKPIECAPEASSGGREWAEMTGGGHLEATRHRVLTYVPSEKKQVRSKGRSRPMSATLTPKRKSARDRPASSKKSKDVGPVTRQRGSGRREGVDMERGGKGGRSQRAGQRVGKGSHYRNSEE